MKNIWWNTFRYLLNFQKKNHSRRYLYSTFRIIIYTRIYFWRKSCRSNKKPGNPLQVFIEKNSWKLQRNIFWSNSCRNCKSWFSSAVRIFRWSTTKKKYKPWPELGTITAIKGNSSKIIQKFKKIIAWPIEWIVQWKTQFSCAN